MRPAALLLLLVAACSEGTDPGNQYYGLSQVQAEGVTDQLVRGAIGPLLPLAPATVGTELVQVAIATTQDCPDGGTISLTGSLRGNAASGSAALLLSAGQSLGQCGIRIEGKGYDLYGLPVLSLGGFVNYLNGVMVTTQTAFISGTVQVVGDQNAQAICPVDLTVTITGWAPPVRAQGTVCGRGIDQLVTV